MIELSFVSLATKRVGYGGSAVVFAQWVQNGKQMKGRPSASLNEWLIVVQDKSWICCSRVAQIELRTNE